MQIIKYNQVIINNKYYNKTKKITENQIIISFFTYHHDSGQDL